MWNSKTIFLQSTNDKKYEVLVNWNEQVALSIASQSAEGQGKYLLKLKYTLQQELYVSTVLPLIVT